MTMNTYIPTITLTAIGLYAPMKRCTVTEQITKEDPYICCLQETHLRSKDTHRK